MLLMCCVIRQRPLHGELFGAHHPPRYTHLSSRLCSSRGEQLDCLHEHSSVYHVFCFNIHGAVPLESEIGCAVPSFASRIQRDRYLLHKDGVVHSNPICGAEVMKIPRPVVLRKSSRSHPCVSLFPYSSVQTLAKVSAETHSSSASVPVSLCQRLP